MKSLSESLQDIQPIFESRYAYPLPNVTWDEFKKKYGDDFKGYRDTLSDIIEGYHATDELDVVIKSWEDSGHPMTPEGIPVVFSADNKFKFRRAYSNDSFPKSKVGNGSLGLVFVSCSDQEEATCRCWNEIFACRNHINGDYTPSKTEMADIIKSFNLTQSWVDSCINQCNAIYKYLAQNGIKDLNKYRAVRYGTKDNNVAQRYEAIVNAYKVSGIYGKNRNSYDPTDIILYDQNLDLEKLLPSPSDNVEEIYNGCVERFKTKQCLGIALKKVEKNVTMQELNVDPNVTIQIDQIEPCGNNAFKAQGKIVTKGVTDSEGEDVGKQDELYLTMRTFGNSIGVDVTKKKGLAALGKVPVDVWKKMIGAKDAKKSNLTNYLEKFRKLNESQIKKCIEAGIKDGPGHLPFILMH